MGFTCIFVLYHFFINIQVFSVNYPFAFVNTFSEDVPSYESTSLLIFPPLTEFSVFSGIIFSDLEMLSGR